MSEPSAARSQRRDSVREERLEVLRLLEGGDITAEEAATLLDALDRSAPPPRSHDQAPPPLPDGATRSAAQVRIRVTESETDRAMVNLAFPLALIDSGLKIAGQFVPEYLPKAEAIRESVTSGFRGLLVDVDDGGQRVEIIVE